jgi:outer membrane protein W
MNVRIARVALLVVGALFLHPLAAAEPGDVKFRFGLAWVNPTGSGAGERILQQPIPAGDRFLLEDYTFDPQSAGGAFFSWEYYATSLVGIEFGVSYSSHDVNGDLNVTTAFLQDGFQFPDDLTEIVTTELPPGKIGEMTVMPITVGVNFHPIRSDVVDLYVGPQIAMVFYGDLDLEPLPEEIQEDQPEEFRVERPDLKTQDDFVLGAVAGIDWHPGAGRWGLGASVQYLDTGTELADPTAEGAIVVDPWIVRVVVALRL